MPSGDGRGCGARHCPCDSAREAALRAAAATRAGSLIAGWSAGLPDFTPEAVEKQTGVSAAVITRLAHEITRSGSAAAIIGGAPLAHTNGLFNALAVNALEALVDTGHDQKPILGFTPDPPLTGAAPGRDAGSFASLNALAQSVLRTAAPQMLLLYDANPDFLGAPGNANPRSHRENSLHRQLWQLY